MFYMPGTKMLFGDAKETCDGKEVVSNFELLSCDDRLLPSPLLASAAIKRGLEARG